MFRICSRVRAKQTGLVFVSSGGGGFTISTAPTLTGSPVVGQRIFANNGTYSVVPDSYAPVWTVGGVTQPDVTGDALLVLDTYAGLAIGYSEVATKASYTNSASNAATPTAAVTNISLANAITAFTRTSATTVVPMTWSATLGANVYEGYTLRAKVYSDSALSILVQNVKIILTHDQVLANANIGPALAAAGLTDPTASQWLQLGIETTSPNNIGFSFTYATAITPTDAVAPMVWSTADAAAIGATLTNGNLTVNRGGGYANLKASRGVPTGKKVYWELKPDFLAKISVADASAVLTVDWNSIPDAATCSFNDNIIYYNAATTAIVGGGIVNGDVVGIALDTTTKTVWFAKNNVWLSGDPNTATGGRAMASITLPIYPGMEIGGGHNATANFGTTPGGTAGFTFTPPTGFVAP